MCYAVVDVEGNGQQPPDLVEVAVVPVAAGIIGAPGRWLVKPPRSVSRIAARIHGLTNEALAAAPAFADIESEVREALDAQPGRNGRSGAARSAANASVVTLRKGGLLLCGEVLPVVLERGGCLEGRHHSSAEPSESR
jgi:hypothetical protein